MASHIDDNKTRELSEQGKKNWDLIFGKKEDLKQSSHWVLGSESHFKEEGKKDDTIS